MAITESTKSVWTTTDGTTFDSHNAAVLHESESLHLEQVGKYLAHLQGKTKKEMSVRSIAWQQNCIMGYLQWELGRKVPIETVKDEEGGDS